MLLKIDKKLPGLRISAHSRSPIKLQAHTSIGTATGESFSYETAYSFPRSSGWLAYLDYVLYRSTVMRAQLCNPQLGVMFWGHFLWLTLLLQQTIWKSFAHLGNFVERMFELLNWSWAYTSHIFQQRSLFVAAFGDMC